MNAYVATSKDGTQVFLYTPNETVAEIIASHILKCDIISAKFDIIITMLLTTKYDALDDKVKTHHTWYVDTREVEYKRIRMGDIDQYPFIPYKSRSEKIDTLFN